ncbi:MAG TPA: glycine cleavage system aminomethyltransferase GcvT [bacterium]|nr:glycine cleavage system aminomethyltransferase GcvT [bacterium]
MKRILLEEKHKNLGAKFIEFGGWNMPVHYGGIITEHNAVRNNVGMFDVSHMGKFFVAGNESQKFLSASFPADIDNMKIGKGVYTQLLNETAGIIDDLIIYKISETEYLIIVNAANIEKDFKKLNELKINFEVSILNMSENYCIFAIQGKNSFPVIDEIFNLNSREIKRFNFIEFNYKNSRCFICRTGYTGEDGFEIVPENIAAPEIFDLLAGEIKVLNGSMCGLGCRDTLRLEAGYMLHGNDIDETTTPVEAGLEWSVKGRGYKSEDIIKDQIKNGVKKKLSGFAAEDKGILRAHCNILYDKRVIGQITSGTFSPTLGKSIGIGYVKSEYLSKDLDLFADVRGKLLKIKIVKLPFLKKI